jgi:hypothetical protein
LTAFPLPERTAPERFASPLNADRAIDGTTNGVMSANSVSSTLSENKPRWQLDLGFPEQISLIKIWNRTDCCGDRLSNFYVFVSDHPFASTDQTATLADGSRIYVSDTGNHRISMFDGTGRFLSSVGSMGQAWHQFLSPRGITFDGSSLFLADSGHHQIATVLDGNVHERFGSAGSALGQFQNPANIHYGIDALLVTDTGNNRVQRFDKTTFQARYELLTLLQIQLNQPLSASIREAANSDFVYIADTGNNRVLLCEMPKVTPLPVWTSARSKLMAQDIVGALAEFASTSVESYRAEFTAIGSAALAQHMGEITQISPIYIRGDQALYWFVNVIDDAEFTFYVTFVLENGRWKIRSF